MNWTKMIRTAAIATGMAALLACTGSVYAQEIENTKFDDGPNMVAMEQPTAMNQTTQASSTNVTTAQVTPANDPVQESMAGAMKPAEAWTIVSLASLSLLLAVAGRKRMKNEANTNEWVTFPAHS